MNKPLIHPRNQRHTHTQVWSVKKKTQDKKTLSVTKQQQQQQSKLGCMLKKRATHSWRRGQESVPGQHLAGPTGPLGWYPEPHRPRVRYPPSPTLRWWPFGPHLLGLLGSRSWYLPTTNISDAEPGSVCPWRPYTMECLCPATTNQGKKRRKKRGTMPNEKPVAKNVANCNLCNIQSLIH